MQLWFTIVAQCIYLIPCLLQVHWKIFCIQNPSIGATGNLSQDRRHDGPSYLALCARRRYAAATISNNYNQDAKEDFLRFKFTFMW